jgi:predicted naringenin-chalcone synthase
MSENADIVADTLELLLLNQIALRAALEEVSLWVSHRGSTQVHNNVMTALQALDQHAEAITSGIERLRP